MCFGGVEMSRVLPYFNPCSLRFHWRPKRRQEWLSAADVKFPPFTTGLIGLLQDIRLLSLSVVPIRHSPALPVEPVQWFSYAHVRGVNGDLKRRVFHPK
ncbi:unnamed protein product [Penicillium camemberti]|uniref:Str. FM013 n=1 Tax=Penicillium camemberti (strain FM 013) TaxID=1429867 RepID=A0A0G4PJZ7_PENC3|nr:unnamed protein product [Penicillium camemberti]